MIKDLFINKEAAIKFEILYGKSLGAKKVREERRNRRRIFIVTIIVTLVFTAIMYWQSLENENLLRIERNDYGGGSKEVSLIVDYGDSGRKEKIDVDVNEQKYSEEELASMAKEVEDILQLVILGKNEALDNVKYDLNLVTNLEGYPFTIFYKSENPLLINGKGKIDKEKLQGEVPVIYVATLTYDTYVEDIYFYVVLKENTENSYESFQNKVRKAIKEEDENSKYTKWQTLPEYVDGIHISYSLANRYETLLVFVIGITCSFGLLVGMNKELDKKINARYEEMNQDYPRILNQYALYYQAGLSARTIWSKICDRYESEVMRGGVKRYAYEEMIITRSEINDGMSEMAAYEEFANRCGSARYRAFINLVEQSVKLGSEGLDRLLEEEIAKSRQEEDIRIRMAIQELSTKLLFPMIVMLVVVLVIVMVPAFISFN